MKSSCKHDNAHSQNLFGTKLLPSVHRKTSTANQPQLPAGSGLFTTALCESFPVYSAAVASATRRCFFYPVWASNSKAERPQRSQSSWLAAVHAARALHTSVSASSAPSCVSSVRPLFRSWILCNEAKHFDLFGIILLHSRLWISSQSPFRLPWYKNVTFPQYKDQGF